MFSALTTDTCQPAWKGPYMLIEYLKKYIMLIIWQLLKLHAKTLNNKFYIFKYFALKLGLIRLNIYDL